MFATISVGIFSNSCSSSKEITEELGSKKITIPLNDDKYRTNKEFFRTTNSGKSPNLAMAKKIALVNAKNELAANIQSIIKAVTEQYSNQRDIGNEIEYSAKFEENSRMIVNQSLNDVLICGEEVYKEKDGNYTYYVAIEMSKNNLVDNISDKISKDQKLIQDFEKQKFIKIFDEEMSKFEKGQ